MEWYSLDREHVIFQQDNDPKHPARIVRQWLQNQAIETLVWPSQSPDINPIEHLWAHLKKKLYEYPEAPRGLLELWDRVQDQWNKIDPETCANLVDSMPTRIEVVIKAKGKWTRY